jgi:hypothetical protein
MEATFIVVAFYQVRENYGAHAWDGEGECPQYWKNKGGCERVVATLSLSEVTEMSPSDYKELVRTKSEYGLGDYNDYYQHIYVSYELSEVSENMLREVREYLENADDRDDFGYLRFCWKDGEEHFDRLTSILIERGELVVEGSTYLYQTFKLKEAA